MPSEENPDELPGSYYFLGKVINDHIKCVKLW